MTMIFSLHASLWSLHLQVKCISQNLGNWACLPFRKSKLNWLEENHELKQLKQYSQAVLPPSQRHWKANKEMAQNERKQKTASFEEDEQWDLRRYLAYRGQPWQWCLACSGNMSYSSQPTGGPMLCMQVGKRYLLKAQNPGCYWHPGLWAAAAPLGSGSCAVGWGLPVYSPEPKSWWLAELKSRPQQDINFRNVGVASAVAKVVP